MPTTPKRRGGIARTMVGIVVAAIAVALMVEVSYRVYLFGWDGLSFPKVDSIHPIGNAGILQPSDVPYVVFELKPDLDTYFKAARLRTNAQGLRDADYPFEKPPGTFRVAVLGDSFTMPSGVEIEEAYHSRLEDRLDDGTAGIRYEFINFGVGGYYLLQYYGVMAGKAMRYRPDLFLIGFCAYNDQRAIPQRLLDEPYNVADRTHAALTSFAWATMQRRLFPGKESFEGGEEDGAVDAQAQGIRNYKYVEVVFQKIGELSARTQVPVVVAYLALEPPDPEPIRGIAAKNGLHFVDVGQAFAGYDPSDLHINRIDAHPNAKAHRIIADTIYDYLIAQSLLTPRR